MGDDYHAEIGYPDVEYATGSYEVSPTTHAQREASDDEYGGFNLPTRVKLTENMYERDPKTAVGQQSEQTVPHIFEITVEEGRVVKLGARTHYDENRDICLIIAPDTGTIVTAWTNLKGDAHDTLDEDNYATP